jgi:hypothetical protein
MQIHLFKSAHHYCGLDLSWGFELKRIDQAFFKGNGGIWKRLAGRNRRHDANHQETDEDAVLYVHF